MKICKTCKESKPLDAFGRAKKNRDGLNAHCKPCAQAKRKANRQRRIDAMSRDELVNYEQRLRDEKRRYRKQHPDRIKAQRARDRLLRNIPKWRDELAELTDLLMDFDAAAGLNRNGEWPRDLTGYPEHKELNERWLDTERRLYPFAVNVLLKTGKRCRPRDAVVARIGWLRDKMTGTTTEDRKAAEQRESRDTSQENLPLSLRRDVVDLQAAFKAERNAREASMTPTERAHSRAYLDAFWFALEQINANPMTAEQERAARLYTRAKAALEAYRKGVLKFGQAARAERAADQAAAEQDREHDALLDFKYHQLLLKYLAEEGAEAGGVSPRTPPHCYGES